MNRILVRSLIVFTFVLLAAMASGQTNAVPASTSPASAPAAAREAAGDEQSLFPPARVDTELLDELRRLDENLARIVMRMDFNRRDIAAAVRRQVYYYLKTHRPDQRVKAVLKRLDFFPVNTEVNVSFIAFPIKDVEAMARKIGAPSPSQEQLKQAWSKGKGRLLATSKVLAVPGESANVQGVQELIYPTEYQSPQGSVSATNTITSATKSSTSPAAPAARGLRWFPVPGEFCTHNVGTRVSVRSCDTEGSPVIPLMFYPELRGVEWATLNGNTREGEQTASLTIQQPVFSAHDLLTSLSVREGETLVTCGGPSKTAKEQIYVFVNADTDFAWPEPPDPRAFGKNKPAVRPAGSSAPSAHGRGKDNTEPRASKAKGNDARTPLAAGTGTPKLIHRSYRAPGLVAALTDENNKVTGFSDEDLKEYSTAMGSSFPPGASVTFNRHEQKVFITTTPENLEVLKSFFDLSCGRMFRHAEVECAFVSFPLKEVENMARKSGNISPTQEQIKRAWADGRGKLLTTGKVGVEVNYQSKYTAGKEIFYPTAYQILPATSTEVPPTRSPGNGDADAERRIEKQDVAKDRQKPKTQHATGPTPAFNRIRATHNPGTLLIPRGFETRHVGTLMKATCNADETSERIRAELHLELTDVKWTTIGASLRDGQRTTQVSLDQPLFHIQQVRAIMNLADGCTVVTGGTLNRSGTEVTYALILTKIIVTDESPQPRP